jgi:predicted patatin/cPLA2 family phospholipase
MLPMIGNAETEVRRKTALIVEGGAMRGAWAAGVLAYLQERGRRQYDLVYAASSGACSAAYFVADMWEPGLAIWRELACKVVRKSNFLRRKPIIDLAYLVDHVMREHIPLSVEVLRKMPTRFFIVLTDCHTGEPVYFHVCDDRVFAALRATSSMPLATRGFDYVDGQPFADGGLSDPIPDQGWSDGHHGGADAQSRFPPQAATTLDGPAGLPGISPSGRSLDGGAKCKLQRRH